MHDPSSPSESQPLPRLSKDLTDLATRAGVALEWSDQAGRPQTVSRETVLRVLDALGHPCDSPQAIATSLAALAEAQGAPSMRTVRIGETLALPLPAGLPADGLRATLRLESGELRELLPALRQADVLGAAPTVSLDGFDVPGYHRLDLVGADRTHTLTVAVAPARAFDAGLAHAWGTSVQVHSLPPESTRDGADPGVGDFSALAAFATAAGAAGAHVLAISPTHAGFAADASNFSPYSPSSRLFHNVFFIDPLAVAGAQAARDAARAAGIDPDAPAAPDAAPLIDWATAGACKLRWLRAVFDRRPAAPSPPVADDLRLHATFEALHAHFRAQGHFDWRQWPEGFQDPQSREVAAFADAHAEDVRFHVWLQEHAERGLQRAQAAARDAGMRVGLVSDLAIGMTGAGSHAWASRRDLLVGLEIGAPPDMMNPRGQRWGLTAFSPRALAASGFEPFLQTLRAAMRQAGGVRIDHVLGLNRLWLVPDGLPATEGAYVRYPLREFLDLLILESHRHRAIVIGEDLGTVPDGFRETLAGAGVLGMAVLWLERSSDGIGFRPPEQWSVDAVAMTTTHDLPTAAGWWHGRDIDWRERIGTEPDAAAARRQRESERKALAALAPDIDAGADGVDLAIAAVVSAPARLVLVPIEDLLGLVEQPNLPGTVDEHPNWRRRLPAPADRLFDAPEIRARLERLNATRGT